jgi:hypothetical protein
MCNVLSNPRWMKNLECERRVSTIHYELNLMRIKGPEYLEGQSNIWELFLTNLSWCVLWSWVDAPHDIKDVIDLMTTKRPFPSQEFSQILTYMTPPSPIVWISPIYPGSKDIEDKGWSFLLECQSMYVTHWSIINISSMEMGYVRFSCWKISSVAQNYKVIHIQKTHKKKLFHTHSQSF